MIYTYTSRVRYSEIDEDGVMTLFALVNNMQDCCTFHGEEVGVGLRHNTELGQAWIIANIQMAVARYPEFGEKIDVITWAAGFRGMIAHRDFEMRAEDGTLLSEAATDWLFIDRKTRKPIHIPDEQLQSYGMHAEKTLEWELGKRKIKVPSGGQERTPFVIREDHLDTNGHVNNAQYIRLAQRILPAGKRVARMRVEFKKQALLDDVIIPMYTVGEDGLHYVSLLGSDREDIFTAEFALN